MKEYLRLTWNWTIVCTCGLELVVEAETGGEAWRKAMAKHERISGEVPLPNNHEWLLPDHVFPCPQLFLCLNPFPRPLLQL